MRRLFLVNRLPHLVIGIRRRALNAALLCERAVCFDDRVAWYARFAIQTVDVLCEVLKQEGLLVEKCYEGVRDCWPVLPRVEFVGESVEGERVLAKVGDVEDSFRVWQIEACEVGI